MKFNTDSESVLNVITSVNVYFLAKVENVEYI